MTNQTANDWQAAQAARAAVAATMHAAFPHLVKRDTINSDGLIVATKNIRIELKRAFPSIKFAVRSERFSGGDSISVKWIDGPTTQQVDAIINKYKGGSFNSSDDLYTYSHDAWTDAFGDAKYISSSRECSDEFVTMMLARVARHLGGMEAVPTFADYKAGRLYTFKQSGGCDFEREFQQALSRHTFCVSKTH